MPSSAVLPRSLTPRRPSNLRLRSLTPLSSHLDMATTIPVSLTQPLSPTTPHHSERLLRDTLKRDEQGRLPTHQKGHSVNVSPRPAQGGEDNYARGTLLRTAMNAPRVASPSPSRYTRSRYTHSRYTFNHTLSHYYDSPEHESQTQYSHHHQPGAQRSPPRNPSPSPSSGGSSHSLHLSPLLPSSGGRSHTLHPSPLLPSSHGMSREASLSKPVRPRDANQGKHHPPAVIVPPSSAELLARLQRVLSAGLNAQTRKNDLWEEMRERERSEMERRGRRNEVQDEVDGWPWGEREYDSPSLASTPSHSTSSGSSSLDISNLTQQLIQFQTHVRNRSKTDPVPPPASCTTQQQGAPSRSRYSQSRERERDEDARLLTPPPTPPFSFQEYPSPYLNKARLTPRRPTHAPVPVHEPAMPCGEGGDDMCSSSSSSSLNSLGPYAYEKPSPIGQGMGGSPQFNAPKASARCRTIKGYVSFASIEGLGEPGGEGGDDGCSTSFPSSLHSLSPYAYDVPSPIGQWQGQGVGGSLQFNAEGYMWFPSVETLGEPGGEGGDDTCSTSSTFSLHSLSPYAYDVPCPIIQGVGGSPQFNAPKASARCRAIEGYVSFPSVEGLGEPGEEGGNDTCSTSSPSSLHSLSPYAYDVPSLIGQGQGVGGSPQFNAEGYMSFPGVETLGEPGGEGGDDTRSTSSSSSLHSLPPYVHEVPFPPIEQGYGQGVVGSPYFNARQASASCAIEGYVSFASVEGLGEPAEVVEVEEWEPEEREGTSAGGNGGGGVLIGALRRLLG